MSRDTDGIIQQKYAENGDVGLEGLSLEELWTLTYSTPGGLFPGRLQFNQLFRWLSALAKEINLSGPYLSYSELIDYNVNAAITGSNGAIYRALLANGPGSAVVDPVGDVTGTWKLDDLIYNAALILDGQTGYFIRPKGQLVLESDEADSTSHAIMTLHATNPDDEGATEVQIKYDDAISRQASADFTRSVDNGSGAGNYPTAKTVRSTHVVSASDGDTTPMAMWSGNSIGFCLGSTGLLPFVDLPRISNMFIIGVKGNQLEILPSHVADTILVQAYDTVNEIPKRLSLNGAEIELGQGNTIPDTDMIRSLGSSVKKWFRAWISDVQAETIGLGGVISMGTGVGSPEGVVDGATGSLYTNQSGGAGTTLYIKESSPSLNTGWIPK